MLSVKRPTATTIQYTVATRSPDQALTARASTYALFLARVVTGICVAIVLLYEYRLTLTVRSTANHGAIGSIENVIITPPITTLLASCAANTNRLWRLVICSGLVWLIFRKSYTSESLLVIRGLGVQTSTSSPSYLWPSSTRFIPTSSIQDIFIYEAFKGFEVRFYLSIVVEDEEDAVVVFPVSLANACECAWLACYGD